MQRLIPTNRLLNVPNVLLKCSGSAARTGSISRVLAVGKFDQIGKFSTLRGLNLHTTSQQTPLFNNVAQYEMAPTLTLRRSYASGSLPEHTKIVLPALSPTMEQGTLAKWAKKEGDHVQEGDLIAEIETDKATMGLESSDEGYIAKILVAEKTRDIPLRTLLCIMVKDKSQVAAFADYKPTAEESSGKSAAPAAAPAPAPAAAAAPPPPPPKQPEAPKSAPPPPPPPQQQSAQPIAAPKRQSGERIFSTPLARKLAAERNIDLSVFVVYS